MIFNSFLLRGSESNIGSSPVRMFKLFLDLTAFFVVSGFSVMLTSFMTLQPVPSKIRNFQDILDMDLRVVTMKNCGPHDYLRYSPIDSSAGIVNKNMEKDAANFPMTLAEFSELIAYDPNLLLFASHAYTIRLPQYD